MSAASALIVACGVFADVVLTRWLPLSWWSPDLALIGLVLAAASSWRPASSHAVGRGQESALALGAVTAGLMACLSLRDAAAIGLLYLGVGWMVERIGSTWDLADERVCRVTIAIAQTAVVAGEMAFVGTLTPGLLLCGIARVAVTVAVLPLAHRAIRVIFNINFAERNLFKALE